MTTDGTIQPIPGWQKKHTDAHYDDPHALIYPGGIEIAPHWDGPGHGWFWRIDRDQAELGNQNDWVPGGTSPEEALAAAVTFLVVEVSLKRQFEEAVFAPGVHTDQQRSAVIERFWPRSVPEQPEQSDELLEIELERVPAGAANEFRITLPQGEVHARGTEGLVTGVLAAILAPGSRVHQLLIEHIDAEDIQKRWRRAARDAGFQLGDIDDD